MDLEIEEIGTILLHQYAEVPIAFEVKSILRSEDIGRGLGGMRLVEERVAEPYIKDYDAYGDGGPEGWKKRFDLRNWGIFLAQMGKRAVAGATIARDTPGVHMLRNSKDLAVLWDIRVHPDLRRSGIGTILFKHAADWAQSKGAKHLKIETQNVNVPACRFYARQGCKLGEINRYAYIHAPPVAHEVMLIWYLDLG